ncbi:MAG TPA: hypothetical protein VLZ74_11230 [Methylocella sp.]|nr:hypothetical protein [Methylocella sp.]
MSLLAPALLKNTAKFTHRALSQIAVSVIATLCTTLLIQSIDLAHKAAAVVAQSPIVAPPQLVGRPYSFVSLTLPQLIPASGLESMPLIQAGPSPVPILATETRAAHPKPRSGGTHITPPATPQKIMADSQFSPSPPEALAPVAAEMAANETAATLAAKQAPPPWGWRWFDLLGSIRSPSANALVDSVTSLSTSLAGVFHDPRG